MNKHNDTSFLKWLLSTLLIAVLLCSTRASAFRPDQYAIELSPASNRLTQQTVNTIFQDSKGFIWLLTQEGLNRFDGYEVISFTTVVGDPTSLSHQLTLDIAEDAEGSLWIATQSGGINLLDESTFTFRAITTGEAIDNRHPLSDNILRLEPSKQGGLWVGYGDRAAFSHMATDSETFTHYFLPEQNPEVAIEAFVEHEDGNLYIAADRGGIYRMQTETGDVQPLPVSSQDNAIASLTRLSSLTQLDDGALLITATTEGVFIYDPRSRTLKRHPIHDTGDFDDVSEVYTATVDSDGNLWFGTSAGVAVYDTSGKVTQITSYNSALPSAQVISILQTREGEMWLGTYFGLAQGKPTRFQTFTADDGLLSSAIYAIESDADGDWWIGTERGLAKVTTSIDAQQNWFLQSPPDLMLEEQTIMSLAANESHIYAGTIRSGLFQIDLEQLTATQYQADGRDGSLSFEGIPVLDTLADGRVLVGTFGGGLNIFDAATSTFVVMRHDPNSPSSISDDRVVSMLIDSSQRVWVGTQRGVNLFDTATGTFRRFTDDDTDNVDINESYIFSLAEDKKGNIWIGTRSGGLHVIEASDIEKESATIRRPPDALKMPSTDIYGILVDDENNKWVSHNAGISVVNSAADDLFTFDESSGLQGREFTQGASHRTQDGTLLFGGEDGFNPINPGIYDRDRFEPEVQLTSFKLLNENMFFEDPYSRLSSITLNYDYQFASLMFAAMDYRDPDKLLYRYRIDGLHNEWIDLGTARQVSISGLGYGDYRIRINSTNASQIWTSNERRISLVITPPFWMTNYAFAVYFSLLAFAVYSVFRNQQKKEQLALARRVELEEKVRERTIDLQQARLDAEEAAKVKSNFLAAMSHEIRTPMHGMLGMNELLLESGLSAQQRAYARTANESGKSLLEMIDSILDYSKLDAGKLEAIASEFNVRTVIEDVTTLLIRSAAERNSTLYIVWKHCDAALLFGDKGKLRQVLINLIGNAIKFTEDGNVTIWCETVLEQPQSKANRAIRCNISVEDSGIGIPEDNLDSIFDAFTQADSGTTREFGGTGLGLSITKELVELMGGELSVRSRLGEGSTFTASIVCQKIRDDSAPEIKELPNAFCVTEDDLLFMSVQSRLRLHGVDLTRLNAIAEMQDYTIGAPSFLVDQKLLDSNSLGALAQQPGASILARDSKPNPDIDGLEVVLPPYNELELFQSIMRRSSAQLENKEPGEHTRKLLDKIKSVLLVEDVSVNQLIAAQMLSNIGVTADIADNGADAVAQAKSKRFDAILMDCQMPILDGYEAARQIRIYEHETGKARTPIIALTAAGDPDDIERATDAGMDGLVRKPFSLSELSEVLENLSRGDFQPDRQSDNTSKQRESANDAPGTTTLDLEVVATLVSMAETSDSPDLLQRLLTGFRDQFEQKHISLVTALKERDEKEVKSQSHAIKSMSTNMGAKEMRKIAEKIERSSHDYDQASALKDTQLMLSALKSFEHSFKQHTD
ncbi:MAG: two-component regulator propeller domain-containing protein [Congregibacter sp.]